MLENEKEYRETLDKLNKLLSKGFTNLSLKEEEELDTLTNLIKDYEEIHCPLPF